MTLVALCFTLVLAISLSSYLALAYRSYHLSTRLLNEDKARQLAQVGLEEALWSLNQNTWNSSGSASSTSWTTTGANRSVTLNYSALGQGATGQLVLTVTNYASIGPVTWPSITSAATVTLADGRTVTKTLLATTRAAALFGYAVASAGGGVGFANSGTLDSFDASLGTYNQTTAPFSAGSPNIGSAAVVAGNDVTITNAIVNGYVATFANAVLYSGTGKIKTLAGSTMDFTRISKSAYIPTVAITEPNEAVNYTGRLTGGSQTIGTSGGPTEYWYTDEYFGNTSLTLDTGETLTVNGPVKVRVYNDLIIQNTGKINVTANGRLELFVGDDVLISGTGGIQNNTTGKYPKNVALFNTTSWNGSRTFNYSSSADFRGVMFTEANQIMLFSSDVTIYGALLSTNYHIGFTSTNPIIHYDTSLRNLPKNWFSSVASPFIINQLTEP